MDGEILGGCDGSQNGHSGKQTEEITFVALATYLRMTGKTRGIYHLRSYFVSGANLNLAGSIGGLAWGS